jgi:hypothetical protein
LKPEREHRKITTPAKCPEFESREGLSYSPETKHDRRTAPEPKMFVSKRKLQKQWSEPQNAGLGSGEDKLRSLRSQTQKMSWVRVSVKMLDLGIIRIIFL